MEPNLEDVWEQALVAERLYGDDAIETITIRMIASLKRRDYIAAGFWSAVANRLSDVHAIKTNFSPIPFSQTNSATEGADSGDLRVTDTEVGLWANRQRNPGHL